MFAIVVVVAAEDEGRGEELEEFECGLLAEGVLVPVPDPRSDGASFAEGATSSAVWAV